MRNEEKKEIISALRQLLAMCDFVDQYGDSIDADPFFDAVETAIAFLHKSEWIPVSERLPDIHDEVLVTAHGEVSIAWLYLDGEWRSNDMPQQMFKDIIAWMPLPEPYKGGEEE